MAGRLVICFDSEALLRAPCPVLYPEWERDIRVVGPDVDGDDWVSLASALAAAELTGAAIEVWDLQGHVERCGGGPARPGIVDQCPTPIRQRLLGVTVRRLIWCPDDPGAVDMAGGVALTARWSGPRPSAAVSLAQRYLLPIALRALWDEEGLLRAFGAPQRPLGRVAVIAHSQVLEEAQAAWASRLAGVSQRLELQRREEERQGCRQALLAPEKLAANELQFKPPAAAPLRMRFFQRLGADDCAVEAWFKQLFTGIEEEEQRFEQELRRLWREAVARLAAAAPPRSAATDERRTCVAMRDELRAKLASSPQPVREDRVRGLRTELHGWIAHDLPSVLVAARRRATARQFWTWLSLTAAGSVVVLVVGRGVPDPLAWAWPDLALPAAAMVAALVAMSFASVSFRWWRARRAMKRAAHDYAEVSARWSVAARERIDRAERTIERMTEMRNLALLKQACTERAARLGRIDAHIRASHDLSKLVADCAVAAEIVDRAISTERRPEECVDNWWMDRERMPEIKLGQERRTTHAGELAQLAVRYGGAHRIEIEATL